MLFAKPMQILLLREQEDPDDKYHMLLESHGYFAHSIPVLSFNYMNFNEIQDVFEDLSKYSAFIFTSKRAVVALIEAIGKVKLSEVSEKNDLTIYVVGKATGAILKSCGFSLHGCNTGNAKELSELIITEQKAVTKPMVFFCGNLAKETLPMELTAVGIPYKSICCYETIPNGCFLSNMEMYMKEYWPDAIVFFSPSGAEFYLAKLAQLLDDLKKTKIVCIGKTTAAAVKRLNVVVSGIANKPTPAALLEKIKELLSNAE